MIVKRWPDDVSWQEREQFVQTLIKDSGVQHSTKQSHGVFTKTGAWKLSSTTEIVFSSPQDKTLFDEYTSCREIVYDQKGLTLWVECLWTKPKNTTRSARSEGPYGDRASGNGDWKHYDSSGSRWKSY